jgi:alkanesulfonate monooxygenase SsuD/methylene tetrahydromethanopterin reductase-like flavin-dependent oxidoreductase (luciferase family)
MTFRLLRQGRLIPVPPPDKALRFLETQGEAPPGLRRRSVLGDPSAVRAGLEEVAADYGAEEAIVVTITYEHAARRRSYELIADAFGLDAAGAADADAARARRAA